MPKSGSTLLSTMLSRFPGMRRENLVAGYGRREQEICLKALDAALYNSKHLRVLKFQGVLQSDVPPAGFVAQMHLRHSETTQQIIEAFRITPVVLVRDIFDALVSLADHFRSASPAISMAFADDGHVRMDDDALYRFLADTVAPWHVGFFVSWMKAGSAPILRYEDLIEDPERVLAQAARHAGLPVRPDILKAIIAEVETMDTRRNKAVTGRGAAMPEDAKAQIRRLAAYYGDVDLSKIGLSAA